MQENYFRVGTAMERRMRLLGALPRKTLTRTSAGKGAGRAIWRAFERQNDEAVCLCKISLESSDAMKASLNVVGTVKRSVRLQ